MENSNLDINSTERFNGLLFMKWAGLRLIEENNGSTTIELIVQDYHRGGGGTEAVNGGILAYMVDALVGSASRSAYGNQFLSQVTSNLNISYLNMLQGDRAIGKGRVMKKGRSVCFVDVEIFDENGLLCVKASGVLKVYLKKFDEEK